LKHVLVVDDDPALRAMVANYLVDQNVRVSTASDGREMARVLAAGGVDLLILDLKLGNENGLEIVRALRAESDLPIIVLTGQHLDEIDRVVGLELGADDYLTKPFSPRTLLARIKALLRRAGMESSAPLAAGRVTLDPDEHTVRIGKGAAVHLTKLELRLLQMLLANAGRTVGSDRLLVQVWGHRSGGDRQLLKQLVHRLRQKIEPDPAAPALLRTAAAGYKLVVE
jgi:DNA-binding response OmpR family regulator